MPVLSVSPGLAIRTICPVLAIFTMINSNWITFIESDRFSNFNTVKVRID